MKEAPSFSKENREAETKKQRAEILTCTAPIEAMPFSGRGKRLFVVSVSKRFHWRGSM